MLKLCRRSGDGSLSSSRSFLQAAMAGGRQENYLQEELQESR
jgi:hypothetical protein